MVYLVIVIGYLLGFILNVCITERLVKNKDIRRLGDGNAG